MVNKAIVMGRLGRDPESRHFDSGKVKTSFTVATDSKVGENTFTEWHDIECWGKTAEFVAKYVTRGTLVYVEGMMRTNSFENKKGEKVRKRFIAAQNIQKLTDPLKKDVSTQQKELDYSQEDDLPF